jgi:hypothetical protein
LLSILNNELGTLSFPRSNFFSFDGMNEIFAKTEAGNGHIIQSNTEIPGPLYQNLSDLQPNKLPEFTSFQKLYCSLIAFEGSGTIYFLLN